MRHKKYYKRTTAISKNSIRRESSKEKCCSISCTIHLVDVASYKQKSITILKGQENGSFTSILSSSLWADVQPCLIPLKRC